MTSLGKDSGIGRLYFTRRVQAVFQRPSQRILGGLLLHKIRAEQQAWLFCKNS